MTRIALLAGLWISALVLPGAVLAAERFDDWQVGDFIFHESTSPQANAIRIATGSAYTHMGIVGRNDDGFYVLEAGRTVSETSLPDFIGRGVGSDYAVYRVADLAEDLAAAALAEARTYMGAPYDIFFRLDPAAIYCSELPYHAFLTVGVALGAVERLGDLNIDTPEGREIFLSRWQEHPDCLADGLDREGCWSLVQDQEIVTPLSIALDPGVERVFSTFDISE
jgi:hypothetical protein